MRALLLTLCGCSRGVGVPNPPPLDWYIPIAPDNTIVDMSIEGTSNNTVHFNRRRFVLNGVREGVAYYQEWREQ